MAWPAWARIHSGRFVFTTSFRVETERFRSIKRSAFDGTPTAPLLQSCSRSVALLLIRQAGRHGSKSSLRRAQQPHGSQCDHSCRIRLGRECLADSPWHRKGLVLPDGVFIKSEMAADGTSLGAGVQATADIEDRDKALVALTLDD